MTEKKKALKNAPQTTEDKEESLKPEAGTAESRKSEQKFPSRSIRYIKDKKTGKWKIVNPAGSIAYNYLTRDDLPDE